MVIFLGKENIFLTHFQVLHQKHWMCENFFFFISPLFVHQTHWLCETFFNSFRCLCIMRNIGCITLSVARASETLDVRIFFNSSQCLCIRIFGCVHWVKSLLDDGKQKARDRCVLSSCGLIIAQTETCKLSIINFLTHYFF